MQCSRSKREAREAERKPAASAIDMVLITPHMLSRVDVEPYMLLA